MKTLIITGGTTDFDDIKVYLNCHSFDNIIAVDGGVKTADLLGIVPTHIIGDFDSIDLNMLESYRRMNRVICIELEPEKDMTDTQAAMELAIELGSSEIIIIGATGTRLDHSISNIHLLQMPLVRGIPAVITDKHNEVRLINQSIVLKKSRAFGQYVSLIPLTEEVNGITLTGFKYPLMNYNMRLTSSFGYGISNEMMEEECRIGFESGVLILVQSKD